ncbi:hypothetical protein XU18_1435 [Perkinsela sp. CCAP 1560/4]|nr:hypothetical protein XU18_1433 [Perkinsela sp. CCAP 1560/4]KNH07956.1 hypothetical protein XU18_1435 [Perkinsela sp. CCAP 1560/4]|eukprot:KNH07954.1 hypothetical protein XU18_1433 [Perkinsela sp. CCAP 1560/4]
MLRGTTTCLAYYGQKYLTEMSRLLNGRGRHEAKLGRSYIRSHLRIATTYRAYFKSRYERGMRRSLLQGAFYEHGADYPKAMNDLARQKMLLSRPMMIRLAQYEPMAFRSILELISSGIYPVDQDVHSRALEQAYSNKGGYLKENDTLVEELQCGGPYGNPLAAMSRDEVVNKWKDLIQLG